MNNFSDTIGNRTRDLPACIAVPQPTAPPLAPRSPEMLLIFIYIQSVGELSNSLSLILLVRIVTTTLFAIDTVGAYSDHYAVCC
jgi:hypothetical protein